MPSANSSSMPSNVLCPFISDQRAASMTCRARIEPRSFLSASGPMPRPIALSV
jgi:hypothetical protein